MRLSYYKNFLWKWIAATAITVFCVCVSVTCAEEPEHLLEKYKRLYPDRLPMVLGIPGFRVPGVTIAQEKHFGDLRELLAEHDIPYYCMAYDTDEYPLPSVADLSSEHYSIASTRVIPSIVRAIKLERDRRIKNNLPPVEDVIMVMYSQGTVVSYGFVQRLHYFRRTYNEYRETFGAEHFAILSDPVFLAFIESVDMFNLINSIRVQRERDFLRDLDMQLFYERSKERMNEKYQELLKYLLDPGSLFPHVEKFDPPETNKYPKRYVKINEYAKRCKDDPDEHAKIMQYMQDYSLLNSVRELNFMYFSASGSIFGSPHANSGYEFLKKFPVGQFVVKGVPQIKDTRLGSFHHTRKIANLVRESKSPHYPITSKNTLFIVGANGERGDGLVDQPSAHISGHGYVNIDVLQNMRSDDNSFSPDEKIKVKMEVLPNITTIPLKVHHFPVKTLWGLGPTLPGSAYMTKGHPVMDYLYPFIYKDFERIERLSGENDIFLRQFMFEFTFRHITGDAVTDEQIAERRRMLFIDGLVAQFIKDLNVQIIKKHPDIDMQGKYFNAENLTYVLIGSYEDSIFRKGKPEVRDMEFRIRARGFEPIRLTVPARPGKITFVNINLRKEP
ncbi:MAG: hypothetical protein RBU23_09115 [Candidatus Auribacterota bacterium]|nr:hypothetical protein [Candidatus Auribacterota bacterium]